MKITQIIQETTTAGAVATVSSPLGATQSRGNPSIYGGKKAGNLFKGKKTKAPYANSIAEGKQVDEAKLEEEDIIVIPGHSGKRKTGFVARGQSRVDHEVEMARSDILATIKNAKALYQLLQHRSEDEGLEGWVQEKIIKASDYLNAVKEYYDEKNVQQEGVPPAGAIAGGMAGESVDEGQQFPDNSNSLAKRSISQAEKPNAPKTASGHPTVANRFHGKAVQTRVEPTITQTKVKRKDSDRPIPSFLQKEGAKVDRMVKHIEKSEKKLGKSDKEAENIAWATANKRGMLDNKNKKAK